MGRQSSDPIMVNSSIALLQERFRKLEKVKERREQQQQQLLQLLSETERVAAPPSTRRFEPARPSFQSDTVPSTPAADSSLSLGLNLQPKHVDYYGMKTAHPFSTSSTTTTSASRKYESSELDTSLHL